MPIIDYKKVAEQSEKAFFNSKKISQENKNAIKKFLKSYDVKPSRKGIFLRHIPYLLERTKDIKKDMHSRDKINNVFAELRKTLSLGNYGTIINVSVRFVTWLNDGDKPKGFKDIKGISKKKQKRDLSPKDMVTWVDAENLIKSTNSLQIKSIIAVQLDGGFRPSEFVDLNYGDITIKEDFMVIEVKDGKTGRRNVILWRAVPYLLRWYQSHPSKKKKDPLWLQEDKTKGHIIRYKYPAIQKRIRELFKKIGLEKPYDFYNLRHSACVLSKKDNVPEELASAKFGHSVEYYVNTYGRLSPDDILDRYSKHYGLSKREQEVIKKNLKCKCGNINEHGTEICSNCGNALTLGKALEIKNETENRFKELNEKLVDMEKKMAFIEKFEKVFKER